MKKPSPLKSFITVVIAGAAGLGIGYAGVNAYMNKSMQTTARAVSTIEPAAGVTVAAPEVVHPTVNAADTGVTDSVQGTVDSTAAAH
jgi:hypothetical protein